MTRRLRGTNIIASVAEANDCVFATDNEKDYAGTRIANPLREGIR